MTDKSTRRDFLRDVILTGAFVPLAGRMLRADDAPTGQPSATGWTSSELKPLDEMMTGFVREHSVPGASLAVARHGRLLYARGFGLADRDTRRAVQPASLFRIASVSKPLTAMAIMQLVERGQLDLDQRVLDLVSLEPLVDPEQRPDPRWKSITVRQLLHHTGGWDRSQSYDPIGRAPQIARAFGHETPASLTEVIRYMMGQPLDFDPGTRYAYSNLGYLLLGRVIEQVSGQPYLDFMRSSILCPLGITRARLGRALVDHREPDEVRYYDQKSRTAAALYPPLRGQPVALPDGAENFEAYEAHGGWIASTVELVRIATALDDGACPRLLCPATIPQMWHRPPGLPTDPPVWYGLGWQVRDVPGGFNVWHSGLIVGTSALLVRRHDGFCWSVLFNSDRNPQGQVLSGLIDPLIHGAVNNVSNWPDHDLFPALLSGA